MLCVRGGLGGLLSRGARWGLLRNSAGIVLLEVLMNVDKLHEPIVREAEIVSTRKLVFGEGLPA